jgi:hypothetical protein
VKEKRVYTSLETDEELIERIRVKRPWYCTVYHGAGLDNEVWDVFKIQRRLVTREG